jgi:hypothetical protein
VGNINKIEFSLLPFQSLTIPDDKKEVIIGITESQVLQGGVTFNDAVTGKGLSISILL